MSVGLGSPEGCPYKKGDTEPQREEAVKTEADVGEAAQEPGAPRGWTRPEGPSPGACGGSAVLGHLTLDFQPQKWERMNV